MKSTNGRRTCLYVCARVCAFVYMQGLVGLGLGESKASMADAVADAHLDAYTKLRVIPLYRNHTIYHAIDHKYHTLKVRTVLTHHKNHTRPAYA